MSIDPVTLIWVFSDLAHRHAFMPNWWFLAYLWPKKLVETAHFSAKPTFAGITSPISINSVTLILVFSDSAQPIGVQKHVFKPNLWVLAFYWPKKLVEIAHFSAKLTFVDITSISIDSVTLVLAFSHSAQPIGVHRPVFIPNLWFLAYLWPKNFFQIVHFSEKQTFADIISPMSIHQVTLILVFSDSALPIGVHWHVLMPNLWFFGLFMA
jgi:hypothetical protein